MKLKDACSLEEKLWQTRTRIKKQRHHFADKSPSSQSYGFSSSHVWMWELDYKEGWALKNWRFWTVVLEKTLESPLNSKEIEPVDPKGNQPWIFIGRTDAEDEAPVLWPPDGQSWFIGKDLYGGKDWRWEETVIRVLSTILAAWRSFTEKEKEKKFFPLWNCIRENSK